MTAKEELLETIRVWAAAQYRNTTDLEATDSDYVGGVRVTLLDLEELLDSL